MARGDMGFDALAVNADIEILNRTPFEGVPITITFTSVTATAENGEKVVKAGTPIKADGTVDAAASAPAGILLHDVLESRPQGTILKKAYINTTRANSASGLTYTTALIASVVAALPMIVFE